MGFSSKYTVVKLVFLFLVTTSACAFIIISQTNFFNASPSASETVQRRFEDNIVYEANSDRFSLADLREDFLQCLRGSARTDASRFDSRTWRQHLESNSSTNMKEGNGGAKSVSDSLKELNELLKGANVSVTILDPPILFCMLSPSHKQLLMKRKFDVSKFLFGKEVITLGIIYKDVSPLREEKNVQRFLQAGLNLFFVEGTFPEWIRKGDSPAKNETEFVSHILGKHGGRLLHFVVFYERGGFLWHSQLDMNHQVDGFPPNSELSFTEHDSAYEKFKFLSLGREERSLSQFHVPSSPHYFLFQMGSSRFLECDLSRAANVSPSEQPKEHPSLTVARFNRRTLIALREMKATLGPLLVHYWIWSGTMLGWYRQCDVIPYTTDVDFGVWAEEVDNLYTLIGLFTDNEHLIIKQRMGLVENALEFQLNCHGLRVDVFFLYQDKNGTWYAGHKPSEGYFFKYFHPNFTLCSAELLGEKVQVPCETEEVIIAEYGPRWSHPVSSWNYESSVKNRGPNIYWERGLRKVAYKDFY